MSRKTKAILIIAAAIITEILISIIYHLSTPKTDYLECLYFSSQIIGGIFVVSGVVIAVWQYYLSSKSNKMTLEIAQVQRAIDMAEYFKDNVIDLYYVIYYVFEASGILEILKNIKMYDINDFDSDELNKLLTPEQIKKLQNIQSEDKFLLAVINANIIYNDNSSLANILYETENDTETEREFKKELNKTQITSAFMRNYVQKILNNMEYFAMHFKHKTADETVIYQSIHQAYLDITQTLYYFISLPNTDDTSKYYTNLTWLYGEWTKHKAKKRKEQKEHSKKVISDGTIIDENID